MPNASLTDSSSRNWELQEELFACYVAQRPQPSSWLCNYCSCCLPQVLRLLLLSRRSNEAIELCREPDSFTGRKDFAEPHYRQCALMMATLNAGINEMIHIEEKNTRHTVRLERSLPQPMEEHSYRIQFTASNAWNEFHRPLSKHWRKLSADYLLRFFSSNWTAQSACFWIVARFKLFSVSIYLIFPLFVKTVRIQVFRETELYIFIYIRWIIMTA